MTEIKDTLSDQAARLKKLRLYLGLTRKDFEQKFGVSRHTLRTWETGEKNFTENAIHRVVSALNEKDVNCSFEWFETGMGDSPILMQESVDYSSSIEFDPINEKTLNEVLYFKKSNPKVEVFVVGDTRFEPIALTGDYIGLKLIASSDSMKYLGSIAYIQDLTGNNFLYSIKKGNKGQVSLVSLDNRDSWDLKFIKQDFMKIIVWYKKLLDEES